VFSNGEPVSGFVGAHPASAIGQFLDEVIDKHSAPVAVA
jgi:thioredoxin-like negative regulator of GroEL